MDKIDIMYYLTYGSSLIIIMIGILLVNGGII